MTHMPRASTLGWLRRAERRDGSKKALKQIVILIDESIRIRADLCNV